MDPGILPDELKNLSLLEQLLISPVKSMITVFRLTNDGQYGFRGNVINFNQNISTFVNELPRTMESLSDSLIVRRSGEQSDASTFKEFRVRKTAIHRAIQCLLTINPLFRERISLNQTQLDALPEDGNLFESITQLSEDRNYEVDVHSDQLPEPVAPIQENVIEQTYVPNIIQPNVRDQVNRSLHSELQTPVFSFPNLQPGPINESTPGYIPLAFPCLFPYGNADVHNDQRLVKVKLEHYFKHLLLYKDKRFQDPRFVYFATNTLLRSQAMTKGRLYVQNHSELAGKTAEEIRQELLERPHLYRKILSYSSTISSTPPFWFQRSQELQDMVKQLKSPTLFFTLSAPDLQNNEMFRLINGHLREFENEYLEHRRRNRLLNENPLLAAWYFEKRFENFIHNVLFIKFDAIDYWYRVEFQHRVSPHIHGFVWLRGAPSVENIERMTEDELQRIVDYFDNLVCASNYVPPENMTAVNGENPCKIHFSEVSQHRMYQHITSLIGKHLADYHKLLNTVQVHTSCSVRCLRKNRSTNRMVCRFKFPKDLIENSRIIRNDRDKFELQLKRNHPRVNNHNPFVTVHWRGNTDFSPIISLDSVIYYIAKYASKNESSSRNFEEVSNILNNIRTENRTAQGLIQSILCRQCGIRDYSIQECVWILIGFDFFRKSRQFVKITLNSNDTFVAVGEPASFRNPETDYSMRLNQFVSTIIGRPGAVRNEQMELERASVQDMCMIDFYTTYYRRTSTTEVWSKYRKTPILRVFPKLSPILRRDDYCRQQVMLYVPWHGDFDAINPNNLPWYQIYAQYRDRIPEYIDFELIDIEDELEENPDNPDRADLDLHEWMLFLRENPGSQFQQPQAELGLREQDTNFDWAESFRNCENIDQLMRFVSNLSPEDVPEADLRMPEVNFSADQLKVLNVVRAQIHFCQTNEIRNEFRKSVIIQGKAGSGKSTLIKAIRAILNESLGPDSFITLAPTGSAASNINGRTIHNALKISTSKQLNPLAVRTLNELQYDLRNCKFCMIDEMSLLGCTLLRKIDLRLKDIKNSSEPFGGLFLILLGDLNQLPPVMDRAFYGDGYNNQYADVGQELFRQIDSSIILPSSFRQNEEQAQFRELLDRLANGNTTFGDWQLLNSRALINLRLQEQILFNDCVRLFSTNEKANEFNLEKLRTFDHVLRVQSTNNCPQAERASTREADNLEKVLYLSIGARVMLRRNLSTEHGLVNGSVRTVSDILVNPHVSDMPVVVMVNFDNYGGPTVNGSVPIVPMLARWIDGQTECTRLQVPLMIAYGITIHKSQGMTLERTVIEIGSNERQLGLSYVALSRVRSLNNLALNSTYNLERFINIRNSRLFRKRQSEQNRLSSIEL